MSTPVEELAPFVPVAWEPAAGMLPLEITNLKTIL
jgi:hypothetical protein